MCDFCKSFNWGSVGIDDNRVSLACGNSKFPVEKQFSYCPICGRLNPNKERESFKENVSIEVDDYSVSIYVRNEEVVYGCETLSQAIELFDSYLKGRE